MRKIDVPVHLLAKVKANLILEHDQDDVLLLGVRPDRALV